ncbi:MAG: type VI secretion system contractile sheath small subunit [Proteobacteria bacterium]|nr:type VI secretion system contractile sheath small subunit [Pseudomonadota bacterium]
MSKDASVAPKERVNIVYKPSSGKTEESVELPLKQLILGNFSNQEETSRLEERESISINKDNFNEVLKAHKVRVNVNVPNTLSGEEGAELNVALDFNTMKDFGPEAIAMKVPELEKMLNLRDALMALKGPLSNIPEFRKKIQNLIDDVSKREQLLAELGLETK